MNLIDLIHEIFGYKTGRKMSFRNYKVMEKNDNF